MIRLLLMTLLTLFGFENTNKPKHDLRKQVSLIEKMALWFYTHRFTLLLIIMIIGVICVVVGMALWFPAMDPYTNRFNEVT